MVKQSSLDLEQTNGVETLTYRVGQLPSRGTPALNLIFEEDGNQLYFMDPGNGELSVHFHMVSPVTPDKMKHRIKIWHLAVIGFYDKGLKTVATWIEYNNDDQRRLAHFFGFEETGFLKEVNLTDNKGNELFFLMEELEYVIPFDDEDTD